jgi:hypothetical protein
VKIKLDVSFPGQACKDYQGHYYKINQSWVSKFGRLVCTTSGIQYEIGMYDRKRSISLYAAILAYLCPDYVF